MNARLALLFRFKLLPSFFLCLRHSRSRSACTRAKHRQHHGGTSIVRGMPEGKNGGWGLLDRDARHVSLCLPSVRLFFCDTCHTNPHCRSYFYKRSLSHPLLPLYLLALPLSSCLLSTLTLGSCWSRFKPDADAHWFPELSHCPCQCPRNKYKHTVSRFNSTDCSLSSFALNPTHTHLV